MESAINPLLKRLFDYAGLFPPAKLPMEQTVQNYAGYRDAARSWMLGRIIVPLSRLDEFEDIAAPLGGKWRLSVVGQSNWSVDLETIREFNSRRSTERDFVIDCMERRFSIDDPPPSNLSDILVYCEVPPTDNDSLSAIRNHGLMAKVRCGGLDRNAFPNDSSLAQFLATCHSLALPFKATAGLHHPLKSTRPATDSEGADVVDMHGFFNLTIAACFLYAGLIGQAEVEAILSVRSLEEFKVGSNALEWRDLSIDIHQITSSRDGFFHGLGSCSFVEPTEDLEQLKLL